MAVSERNKQIITVIKKHDLTEYKHLKNLLDMAIVIYQECNDDLYYSLNITGFIKRQIPKLEHTQELNELYWSAILFEAPYQFESFMLYMEKNRPANHDKEWYQWQSGNGNS